MALDPLVPSKYYTVIIEDVEEFLPFNIKREKNIIKEEEEVEAWENFVHILHKNFKSKIIRTGREHSEDGRVEKYILGGGGYIEVILGTPLIFKAHFLLHKRAVLFEQAIKKTIKSTVKREHGLELFINSIQVEESSDDELTMEKWMKMHHIYLQKSIVITIVAFVIVAIFELLKVVLEIVSLEYFGIHSTIATIIGAILIAIMFEPLLHKTEELVNKTLF